MKKLFIYFLSFACLFCISCLSKKPQGFTYQYTGNYTGLDTLINIDGYYKVPYNSCIDDKSHIYLMLYPDGLLNTVAYTASDETELIDCFKYGGKNCAFVQWGTYWIRDDTLKIQKIMNTGLVAQGNVTYFYNFQILPTKELLYISKHCITKEIPECNQDPVNPCPKVADFFPLEKKRETTDCPHLKKGWFKAKKE
ncbi:MAG: hypothetical protein E6767_12350 [Dysgonomonas sp.]|nr:hypothetical protein [Dysgonomonas sp.]